MSCLDICQSPYKTIFMYHQNIIASSPRNEVSDLMFRKTVYHNNKTKISKNNIATKQHSVTDNSVNQDIANQIHNKIQAQNAATRTMQESLQNLTMLIQPRNRHAAPKGAPTVLVSKQIFKLLGKLTTTYYRSYLLILQNF